jgi:hypothetical protein
VFHQKESCSYESEQKEDAKKRKLNPLQQHSVTSFTTADSSKQLSRVDKLVTQYVVKAMLPLSTVSQTAFQDLVKGNYQLSLYYLSQRKTYSM